MGGVTASMCLRTRAMMPLTSLSLRPKKERAVGFPKPTVATVFEVVIDGKVYQVAGVALQCWIVERRQKWKGPKGYMFCKRPGLE